VKLYTTTFAPNPRRVEIYLAEKGLQDIERVRLDLPRGEHRTPDMLRRNPLGLLPILELDDGRVLTESLAICEYLEELHPDPPLIGADPWQRAQTREAARIAESLLMHAGIAFQNTIPFFAARWAQTPECVAFGRTRFLEFAGRIDGLLADGPFLAGALFTVADITALCAIDFGKASGCTLPPNHIHTARWLEQVRARPSCARAKS
jgi:glutathione S-transferase